MTFTTDVNKTLSYRRETALQGACSVVKMSAVCSDPSMAALFHCVVDDTLV